MGTVQAHPKPDSYCNEWVALKYDAVEGILPAKKLLKGTPWSLYLVVGDSNADPYLVLNNGHEVWAVHHGEWIVKSPHDKIWTMGQVEFESQFTWRPES